MVIKNCKQLCDFYENLFDSISEFSFKLNKSGKLEFNHEDSSIHPYLGNYNLFSQSFSRSVGNIFTKYDNYFKNPIKENLLDLATQSSQKAYILPLVQSGDFGIRMDEVFTNSLIESAPPNSEIALAVGYFNLTQNYQRTMLKSKTDFKIMTASPLANGFYGSKGFSRHIPDIYRYLETSFLSLIQSKNHQERIRFYEYYKKDWSNFIFR